MTSGGNYVVEAYEKKISELTTRAEKAERELDRQDDEIVQLYNRIKGLEEKLDNFGFYVDDLRFLLSHHGDKIHRYSESHGWLKIKDCLNGIDNEHAKKCGRAQLKEGE